ncbi:MAG: methylenetetrahydrofolate reductase [Actinomycetota bacterium]|nr:methylenetetrahydrofolate reductase [Actinomycetota bacterium]
MSRLREALERGEFVVTGEIAPPVGTDITAMKASVEAVGPFCHALNVTDNQGAALHMSSLGAALALLEWGFEPVFQQTCRDRNRLALQSDLLAASMLGIENVLCITGDDTRHGDHPQSKAVFDLDSTQLISVATNMNHGTDMMGRPLTGGTDLFVGAGLFPEVEPWDIQLGRAMRKVEAGAMFFQSQAIFDIEKFARAVEGLRPTGVKIIAGVLLLKSPRIVDFINEKLAGLMVPDAIADRIRSAADPFAESVRLATEQVRGLRAIADGVHIMPLGADDAVGDIVSGAGLS